MTRVVKSTEKPTKGAVVNVPGNHYDKHGSKNPIVRYLMEQFHEKLLHEVIATKPKKVLDVGCGEGLTTRQIYELIKKPVVGVDLEESVIKIARKNNPKITFKTASIYKLPFKKDSFSLVTSTEVLEHVDNPTRAVKEMKRVSGKYCIFTVPNEPLWRIGNMARGAYLKDFGNTPGHVNHWSRRSFKKLLEPHFSEVKIRKAIMWTIAICKK